MKIKQIYTGCLAQGAYYIESNGEAAVIDPLRESQPYLDMAEKHNAKIRYVFETHFHADFVSGHIDLARKAGAEIVIGPTPMKTGFDCIVGTDGQEFPLGKAIIKLLHTPGHTMESSCFLLIDEKGKHTALFTGDTLFIGDVGRPDLAQHVVAELTEEKLAGYLFDSLRNKVMPLDDELVIYPAHGAGSACGKNLSKQTHDTLGNQKKTNYALDTKLTKELFIKQVLTGLVPPSGYFPKNVLMNIQGYDSIDEVMERGSRPLEPGEFELVANQNNALVLDTRNATEFAKGFIPGSINIGLGGSFAVWVGTLVPDIRQTILIVADEGKEEEVITRLARVGYDNTIGYLDGGFIAWKESGKDVDAIPTITAKSFAAIYKNNPGVSILDVRKHSEYDSEHIVGATNLPLDFINNHFEMIDSNKIYYVHCAGGYRSMIFASILKARGFNNLIDLHGGFKSLKHEGSFQLTEYVCPSTML